MPTANPEPLRIVITGDDFGVSTVVNTAIEEYHRAGALHQASLMVAEEQVAEAVEIARRHPRLRVGLHLTLCDGRATEDSELTGADGRFVPSPARAGLQYAFNRKLATPLRLEIRRQFERFLSLGFPPTYWDGHTHLHLHPLVFSLTLPIAEELGFKSVRLVREPGPFALVPWVFQRLSAMAIPSLRPAGIEYADQVFGLRATGGMTEAAFAEAFRQASGTAEIYFHPGAETNPPAPMALAAMLEKATNS
jgi:hopanoid biosynthesis associated protein HpnK